MRTGSAFDILRESSPKMSGILNSGGVGCKIGKADPSAHKLGVGLTARITTCFIFLTIIISSQISLSHSTLQLSPSENLTKKIGENLYVQCGVPSDSLGKKFSWKFPNKTEISMHGTKIYSEPTSQDMCMKSDCITLYINQVSEEDKGTYTCSANVNGYTEEAKINIDIYKPIAFEDVPPVQNFTLGQSGIIRCHTVGGTGSIDWIRNNKPVIPGGEYQKIKEGLKVSKFTKDDNGVYICRAKIVAPFFDTNYITIRVNVFYPAEIVLQDGNNVRSYVGGKVNLTCKANGLPTPSIYWYKNSMPLKNSTPGISVMDDGEGKSVLTVDIQSENHMGRYNCRATNGIGIAAEATINVERAETPTQIKEVQVVKARAKSVELSLTPPESDGGAAISKYVIRYKPSIDVTWANGSTVDFPADNPTVTIPNLSPNVKYDYEVVAVNAIGAGSVYKSTFSTNDDLTNSASASPFTTNRRVLMIYIIPSILILSIHHIFR